jgi:hypothetical protein
MTEKLSGDRLQLIRSYMEEPFDDDPDLAEDAVDEIAVDPGGNWNPVEAASDPTEWYVPDVVGPAPRSWPGVAVLQRAHIASAVSLVVLALFVGWLVAHMN